MSAEGGGLPVVFTAASLAAHDEAVRTEVMCEFAEYLHAKAEIGAKTVGGAYVDGMRTAEADAELFVGTIRGRWRDG